MKRRISEADGTSALRAFAADPNATPNRTLLTAVRYTLEELGTLHPGRSVEVRVPPAGAVQIIQGTTHRRGTPPAVVEMNMATFLALALGDETWESACEAGLVEASGERTDLRDFFPIFP